MSEAPSPSPSAAEPHLNERIEQLGLQQNVRELDELGYTVIRDPAALALNDRVRDAIVRLAQETDGPAKGYSAGLLLGRDPVFEQAVLVPQLLAIVEVVVGRGALLSQLIGSARPKGARPIGLHADNSWFPAPFPEWDLLVTGCWVTDEFTEDGGCTLVIPGSHRSGTHPTAAASKSLEGAVPIECEKGSIAIWNSRIWHSNYPRKTDGDRVVLHMTYSRIGITPVEDYRHLDDDWLEGKPSELGRLLGRDVFLGTTTATSGGTNGKLLAKTYETVHGGSRYTRPKDDQ
jgi:hypothetical protein